MVYQKQVGYFCRHALSKYLNISYLAAAVFSLAEEPGER